MVYMAGDNNLSAEMVYAIKEMYRVGVTDKCDVLIQFDPSGIGPSARRHIISTAERPKSLPGPPGLSDPPTTDRLNEDGKLDAFAIPVDISSDATNGTEVGVKTLGVSWRNSVKARGENSADPRVLRDFIASGIREHRAKRYMVVLSGHGSGAIGDFLTDDDRIVDAAEGNKPPDRSLSIPSLEWVLAKINRSLPRRRDEGKRTIDILGMDSCLMSMVEVCYQLREQVKFIVGAEGFEAATGWPYHRILETLGSQVIEARDLAIEIVKSYIRYYQDYEVIGASTDQSACDMEKFNTYLVPAIRRLSDALRMGVDSRPVRDAIVLAHWEAQSYHAEHYTDLYDFCDRLQLLCLRQPVIQEALRDSPVGEALLKANDDAELSALAKDVLGALRKVNRQKSGAVWRMSELIGKCGEVKEAIDRNTVLLSCHSGAAFQHSHGLSIYFPWFEEPKVLEAYEKLAFATDAIVMDEKATQSQIRKVESTLQAKRFRYGCSTGVFRSVLTILEGGNLNHHLMEGLPGVSRVEGTGWARFLRKYLLVTQRERRNQDKHLGEDPVKIESQVNPLVSILAPIFSAARNPETSDRGSIAGLALMKNPPDGFYRADCVTKKKP